MKITCPGCYAQFSLDVAMNDHESREALVQALKLPKALATAVPRYLALFRPSSRALSWKKVVSIMAELHPMIDEQIVKRNGIAYTAPVTVWKAGIDQVLRNRDQDKIRSLPLKSNGYLIEIVASLADKQAATLERKRDASLKAGTRPAEPKPDDRAREFQDALSKINGDLSLGLINQEQADQKIEELRRKSRRSDHD